MWERGERGIDFSCSALSRLLVTSPAIHKQIGPFWCWFPGEWFCISFRTLWVSPTNSPIRLEVSPATSRIFQSEYLRLYFPTLESWVARSVLLPICSSWFIRTQMWDHWLCKLPPCHKSTPPWLPIFIPPTSLDECFFFNSLVVGLPYSLIFWQFWLFFVFNLVVVLLLVV